MLIVLLKFVFLLILWLLLLFLINLWRGGGGWRRGSPPKRPQPGDPGAAKKLTDEVLDKAQQPASETPKVPADTADDV